MQSLSLSIARSSSVAALRRLVRGAAVAGASALALAFATPVVHAAESSAIETHAALVLLQQGSQGSASDAEKPRVRPKPKATAKKPAARATTTRTAAARRAAAARRRAPVRRAAPATPALPRFTVPRTASALESDLGTMLGSKTRSGTWGVMVVSLTRRDTLFARGPGISMVPASTMKLMTTAIALENLGPDHQFSTDVLRDGIVDADGTLRGNLVLRGDGDPALSNRYLRGDANAPMELIARSVVAAGVKRITGDIIGDATAFDAQRIPDGWRTRYLASAYAAPVSGLSLNENVVWVAAYPATAGTPARVVLEPASTVLPVVNMVRTTAGASGSIKVRRLADGSIEARGSIGSRSIPRKYSLVVNDPAPFAAGALRAALLAQGIAVDGAVRVAPAPATAVKIAAFSSPPLARLVSAMNRESINHYAELIFRNAARGPQRAVQGTATAAAASLQEFLVSKVGVAPDAVRVTDGSGLSTLDAFTPRAMVQLLAHADRATWGGAFHASLPVAGESELLRNRMKATPAQGNLHAKTGTTNEVISLAGYVTAADGEVIAFAFMYNGTDRWNARDTIDRMGATLAAFARE